MDGVTVTAPAVSQPPSQDPSQHVSVVFAMDYSPSVVDTHVTVMRQAVIDFINAMKVGDYAAIVKFNVTNPNGASVVLPFTRIDGAAGTQALIAAVNADYPGTRIQHLRWRHGVRRSLRHTARAFACRAEGHHSGYGR